jgi:tetratricopeptide (TPR) repeat protein
MKEHGVQGFPSVLLFDGKGALYSRTGYRPGGPGPYLVHLADLKRGKVIGDELFGKARQPGLAGADKARALDAALAAVPESMMAGHVADMEEVVQIDADGALGLKAKHLKRLLIEKARVARQARDLAGAIKLYERILAEAKPSGEELQDVLMEKSSLHFASDDKEAAKKAMDEALAAAPASKSAARIKELRAKVFPDGPAQP